MDGNEMHVAGQALYRRRYLQSRGNMLPIMTGGIRYVICAALCAEIYSHVLF